MMTELPLVSVLMTAYNRERYISEAIESVLNQSYKNFELIIVDDCSSDKTVEIAKQFELKDSRVKVYINNINLGDYPNRNKVASYATGKYLKYLDSDDVMYSYCLDVMVSAMERFPEAAFGLSSIDEEKHFLPIEIIFQEVQVHLS
jgi:glycosyltransferase involved in cell wall biosynthesis